MRGMYILCTIDARSPVERLQPVALIDAHGVGEVAGLDDPELCVGAKLDTLRVECWCDEERGKSGGGNYRAQGHGSFSWGENHERFTV
jgi:hypothetical protein